MYCNIGLDFKDRNGDRFTAVQLVENGKAVALADLKNGKFTRVRCCDNVNKKAFLRDAFNLFCNSIPVVFGGAQ